MTARILTGDALDELANLADGSARCCVTSPPYWGLRDYGHEGQIGLEDTPEEYVARLVGVFREVRRVLAGDGTLWLNLGDSYAAHRKGSGGDGSASTINAKFDDGVFAKGSSTHPDEHARRRFDLVGCGLKPKDLVGVPWLVAFALRADGWYLRSDIIWHKPNPMPESVRDRCTSAHEYVFMLSKSRRYYWDRGAVRELVSGGSHGGAPLEGGGPKQRAIGRVGGCLGNEPAAGRRNPRDVWTIASAPYSGAHFAVMPPALVEPCIRAGSAMGDTILDPFAGACTVGVVARKLRRSFVGIELNPGYADLGRRRIEDDAPLFNRGAP